MRTKILLAVKIESIALTLILIKFSIAVFILLHLISPNTECHNCI